MKKKSAKITVFVILTICICICIYSFSNIIKWNIENKKEKSLIKEYQSNTKIEEIEPSNAININSENEKDNSIYWKYVKEKLLSVDFDILKKKNEETVGWVKVYGTEANYPFVQTTDNSYYLTHSIDKKYTDAGWIFLDYKNNINELDYNTVLYGHARLDKTMFGTLKYTLTKDWYNNVDNHIIKMSTEKENTLWQIFSIYHIDTESYYITTDFKDLKEFQKYITKSLSRSIYKFDANVTVNDKILTLSTCYSNNQKLVIQAKLIKKEVRN